MESDFYQMPDMVAMYDETPAEKSANPFLSGLSNFGANILTTASGVLSKGTDTLLDAVSLGVQQRIVGSVSPTGNSSPDAAASRQNANAAAASLANTGSVTLPSWALPAAAVVGLGIVFALVLRK